jgi:hypothetical protein
MIRNLSGRIKKEKEETVRNNVERKREKIYRRRDE